MKTFAFAGLFAMVLAPSGWMTAQEVRYPSSPSMLTSNNTSQELEVFPVSGKAFTLTLPSSLDVLAYAPDGRALYARHFGDMSRLEPATPGLFKVEFNPTRIATVPGSAHLSYYAVAVSASQDKIIASARQIGVGQSFCGLFELGLPSGRLRRIAESSACEPVAGPPSAHWEYISLSPDGTRAVALRNYHLELISLSDGTVSVIGDGKFELGTWSPDGRWLAATKTTGDKTVLLDAHTLIERRSMGRTDLAWSLDSRYLLARKRSVSCGLGEVGTLEIVDVQTGKRTEVESSKCLIDRSRTGWMSSVISP